MYVHLCTPIFFLFVFISVYLCAVIRLMPATNGKESVGSNADWLRQSPTNVNLKKMKINELIGNEKVTITVSATDLKEFALLVVKETKKAEAEKEKPETYMTPNEVADLIGVSTNTLWRWEKEKYLIPLKIGRKSRYRKSDVEALMTGRNNKE